MVSAVASQQKRSGFKPVCQPDFSEWSLHVLPVLHPTVQTHVF